MKRAQTNKVSLRASVLQRAKQSAFCGGLLLAAALAMTLIVLTSCAPVDLNAPLPTYDTGVDPNAWATIPAGSFIQGQAADPASIDYDYEIMVTDVTVSQYVDFLNTALADGTLKVDGEQIVGFYPGDEFHAVKHEIEITATDYIFVPLNDPASRFTFDGAAFSVVAGYENHPMTNVSWFGAWGYCGYYSYSLPTELEWEKAARGSADDRPFPWGYEIARNNANFYSSRDPFEDMGSFGSRTSPVGFYNGQTYDGYVTLDSASPYGLYDMSGNVWQWTGDVYEGMHYRFMRGGSKDTYDMDLRIWVRNNATPTYYSPGVGFRCV
ncbi:MAG: SUMF1/EgtB/PvdO family nonheme iron enzyme, partial [Candidatus Atribacteria bacterium]|nr:SUMF1/EgtB/PvdO family nonheme iron enzyme [Candidatus Atribacteria bacterium]